MAFTREARDVLIECCVEFLTLISSEANEIAEKECKKTIATEHIEMALRDLGFPEYVEQVLSVAEEHKEQLKVFPGGFFLVVVFKWRDGENGDLLTYTPGWRRVDTDKREENEQDGQERVH